MFWGQLTVRENKKDVVFIEAAGHVFPSVGEVMCLQGWCMQGVYWAKDVKKEHITF